MGLLFTHPLFTLLLFNQQPHMLDVQHLHKKSVVDRTMQAAIKTQNNHTMTWQSFTDITLCFYHFYCGAAEKTMHVAIDSRVGLAGNDWGSLAVSDFARDSCKHKA